MGTIKARIFEPEDVEDISERRILTLRSHAMKWNGEKFEEAFNDDLDNLLSQKDRRELSDQIESDRSTRIMQSAYPCATCFGYIKEDEHRVVQLDLLNQ